MDLVFQLVLACGAVIGLMYLTMRLLRHYMHGSMSGRHLEVIEAVPLGRSSRLVLVRIGAEYLVLGVGEDGVRKLADWEPAAGDLDDEERGGAPGAFGDTLRSLLRGSREDDWSD